MTSVARVQLRAVRAGVWRTADHRFIISRRCGAWQLRGLTPSAGLVLWRAQLESQLFRTRGEAADALALACHQAEVA